MSSKWSDFLTEKNKRSSLNRLDNWKENKSIVVWIHTNTHIYKRMWHMVPYVSEIEDENTGKLKTIISYLPFVCHEDVNAYIKQGSRNYEPQHCPICLLIDYLKNNGNIHDNENVWDSSIGDKKRDRICSKADFTGDTEAGGDWRLSFKPTLEYVLAVIEHDNPDGIKVATEKFSLGEKIKSSVQKEIDRKGPELGDPDLNPYAFKWTFDPKARIASEYYDAYPYDQAVITPEIEKLLQQDGIDLSNWVTPGNTRILRNAMENHVVINDINLDMFFDNVLPNEGTNEDSNNKKSIPKKKLNKKDNEKNKKNVKTKTKQKVNSSFKDFQPSQEEQKQDEENTTFIQCPLCKGKGVKKNGKVCVVCNGNGKIEVDEDEEIETPTPPKKPKEKKTRQTVKPEPKPEPKPEDEDDEEDEDENDTFACGGCGKDIPGDATTCPFCKATFE